MVAIAESVGTSPDAMGPVIVVDTVVGYVAAAFTSTSVSGSGAADSQSPVSQEVDDDSSR